VHVAYHWLWLVPRELARRSRTVPYHDGIRTELGARPIAPGERVALTGRLLPPASPGLYWLQWDMVEEGVTWFAQVAPRQPRTLVVVLPPLAWMVAPLPLLIALLGLFRMIRIPDVWWCAAALAAKPLILTHDALLEPTAVAYWLIVAIAVLVPAIALAILPRELRPWALLVTGILGSLVILGDVVYYRFFGDVLSTPTLLAAHQTGHVWGTIDSLVTPGLVWLVLDVPIACWMVVRTTRRAAERPLRRPRLAAAMVAALVAASGLALSAPRVLASTPLDQLFRARSVVEQLGPFGYHAYDGWNYARASWLRPPVTATQLEEAASWLAHRAPTRGGVGAPGFGAASGRNLIVVQVESLQDYVVDLQVDGQEVMPHLRRWTADSLRFANMTDQTSEGRTSDAEFAAMTSLLPLDHGAVAFRYPSNHYLALPRVLAEQGYATLSAVPFEPGFWNRQVMHPAYGFAHSLFEPDFQMTEQIGWGLNDRDFLRQMVPHLERMPRPFAAWMITLSLHHPFADFPAAHKVLKLGALEGTSFGNYLHTMRFFDGALDEFKEMLARDGLLDSSVVVVFGDHDAGFPPSAALTRAIGLPEGDVAWALNDRIPLFVRLPSGPDAGLSGPRTGAAGQVDIAPTLLALLGIDASPLPYLGRNLLGPGDGAAVVRPYGDWLDAHHLFLAQRPASICYDISTRAAVTDNECAAADAGARRTHDLSRLIVVDDLQERLRVRVSSAIR
jgi:lipoteichoic acid synthase